MRMTVKNEKTNPDRGSVKWAPLKSLWYCLHLIIAVIGGHYTLSLQNVFIALALTLVTLCLGHSVGLHRLLVHRSFCCPKWLEYFLIHLGVLVGMGGPRKILYMHDIRDWAQRHASCHPMFTHQNPIWIDYLWQNHCEVQLQNPPEFQVEDRIQNDRVYQWMDQTWMLQQLPLALGLFLVGSWGAVIWGISVRVVVSLTGHWLVGYLAHNGTERDWNLRGHAVQGYNIAEIGLLTMGEAWHNNHHAFPESARLGLTTDQPDPGWWVISFFTRVGLIWDVKLPKDLPERTELEATKKFAD